MKIFYKTERKNDKRVKFTQHIKIDEKPVFKGVLQRLQY